MFRDFRDGHVDGPEWISGMVLGSLISCLSLPESCEDLGQFLNDCYATPPQELSNNPPLSHPAKSAASR